MRYKVIAFLLIIFTAHLAEAQQPNKIPRIGYLTADSRSAHTDVRAEAFRQGLGGLGYVEGKNILIEWRNAEGKLDRFRACGRASASWG
jgi:putative ABC transport system substrate-binding protein